MDGRNIKRITIFAGHYGSGKTNIAVNYAFEISKHRKNVSIADLDIVNPYFRTKDCENTLKDSGIRLISSPYANTNVDTPALPGEAYAIIDDMSITAIIDVGGDDRGALALGRYAKAICEQNDYEMLFVINKYRYLTGNADETVSVMREIEDAAGIKFTGIVNNSNLGDETTAADVLDSVYYAEEVSAKTNLEIKMTTVREDLAEELEGRVENIFPIKLYVRQSWLREGGK